MNIFPFRDSSTEIRNNKFFIDAPKKKNMHEMDGITKMNSSISRRIRINFWIDFLAFLSFVLCAVSGYAIMGEEHGPRGEGNIGTASTNADESSDESSEASFRLWSHLHLLTGWILVALVIAHTITHRRWISVMISKSFRP